MVDLGVTPTSNVFVLREHLDLPEDRLRLRVLYCDQCWLVQTEDVVGRESLFVPDYAYFSSMSSTWLDHASTYCQVMIHRFDLGADSQIVEIASNDGYLLRNFQAAGIPNFGVEPTRACASAARAIGVETVEGFFGVDLAQSLKAKGKSADLMVANNVLAHVPDINDFVVGFSIILKPTGVVTFEFPHLLRLVQDMQFDTIYHEHFSYLSLTSVMTILKANGLTIFDVEELSTHGGSLRVFAQRQDTATRVPSSNVADLLALEAAAGVTTHAFFVGFQDAAEAVASRFLAFLKTAQREGKKVAAYGAAAKGNTLLNFAGVDRDLIDYVVDKSPSKIGRFLPGSHIEVVAESVLRAEQPDYVVILPWNIADEISVQSSYIRDWGGQFVTAIPEIRVF